MPERLSIIAAGGALPLQIYQAQRQQGRDVYLLALETIADAHTCDAADALQPIFSISKIIEILRSENVTQCVFIGRLDRPDMTRPREDKGLMEVTRRFMENPGGDDALLRAVVGYFEDEGFQVLGADEVMQDFKAPLGCLTQVTGHAHERDIERGTDLLRAISPFDIGQACVISLGQVIAIEGPEGTDAMLARAGEILSSRGGHGGVLIKLPKSAQDKRIDLPAIGPMTIANAILAGLEGLVFQADGALLIDRDACVARADAAGFFIEGRGA